MEGLSGMILRKKGSWLLRRLREELRPKKILRVGLLWRRFPGDRNPKIWLKEGDRNTRFFHRMANAHKRRNLLQNIIINGKKLEKEVEIKEGG